MKLQKIIILLASCLLPGLQIQAQDTIKSSWKAEVAFDHAFHTAGYVQVREFQYDGTRLSLGKDLGMKTWNSASVQLIRNFRNLSSLTVSCEYFFFHGSSVIDGNVWFNSTNLDGSAGLSINQTNLYRVQIYWNKPIRICRAISTSLDIGLIYDGMEFRINGTILPGSPRGEPREDFISQALPYPMAGFRIGKSLSKRTSLSLEATGTYIPLFKSFFIEGGNIYLRYYTVNAQLGYTLQLTHFYLTPAIHYRLLSMYENSQEDTNDFYITTFGVNLTLGWKF
jgi:hypothetical protein